MLDTAVRKEFDAFVKKVNTSRAGALFEGRFFTDKSAFAYEFLAPFEKLVSGASTIVEFGSGVPLLALWALEQGLIKKVIAIEHDQRVLAQLRAVVRDYNLDVDIVANSISRMKEFPRADVAVSFNALYGYAPTPEEMNVPPKLLRDVVSETAYAAFGIFRDMNNCQPWSEYKQALNALKAKYDTVESNCKLVEAKVFGYQKKSGQVAKVGPQMMVCDAYWLIGRDVKLLSNTQQVF